MVQIGKSCYILGNPGIIPPVETLISKGVKKRYIGLFNMTNIRKGYIASTDQMSIVSTRTKYRTILL
jgi:hypothetical protein